MAHPKTLTEAQLALLRWISESCPPGVIEGDSYRISAAALRSRGLLTITGRGTTWAATITPAGRDLLGAAAGPNAPKARQANMSVTEELIAEVTAADGSLTLDRPRYSDKTTVDYERRARAAEQHGKVPAGKRLAITRISGDQIRIDLVDGPDRDQQPVSVPNKVAKYHPIVRNFRDDTRQHEITRVQLGRALLVLQALITAAEAHGMTVVGASAKPNERGWSSWTGTSNGHLTITFDEEDVPSSVELGWRPCDVQAATSSSSHGAVTSAPAM